MDDKKKKRITHKFLGWLPLTGIFHADRNSLPHPTSHSVAEEVV
jgi:hypothetical protein